MKINDIIGAGDIYLTPTVPLVSFCAFFFVSQVGGIICGWVGHLYTVHCYPKISIIVSVGGWKSENFSALVIWVMCTILMAILIQTYFHVH